MTEEKIIQNIIDEETREDAYVTSLIDEGMRDNSLSELGTVTKQDDIREEVEEHIAACIRASGGTVSVTFAASIAKSLLVLLDGLGVVRKVDRELPFTSYAYTEPVTLEHYNSIRCKAEQDMLSAGYTAVEDLV